MSAATSRQETSATPEGTMRGRVCLVTGATSGHGRAMAGLLAELGADVILLGRDPARCRETREEIASRTGRAPEVLLCDLASLADVERAADELLASGRPLHVLVNNAGLVSLGRRESADGYELGFAVNYLAHFELTRRLLSRLRESAPARVVNVGSDAHRIARLDLDDLQLTRGYGATRSYCRSKLAIVYWTLELARRTEGSGVTANAVDPGPVASRIGSNNPGLAYTLVGPLLRTLLPDARRAARTAMWLACGPDLEGASGGYYRFMRRREPRAPRAEELGPRLWEESLRLVEQRGRERPEMRHSGA